MKLCIYTDVHWCTAYSIVNGRGETYSTRLGHLIDSVNWVQDLAQKTNCDKIICGGDFFDRRGTTTLWKEKKCDLHPTMKPVELVSRAIKNSSKQEDGVLDLFGGSGSTLIACEQLNRKCYMMELDPHYISVIIERYINFTGNDVYRLNPDGSKTNWRDIKCEKEEKVVKNEELRDTIAAMIWDNMELEQEIKCRQKVKKK